MMQLYTVHINAYTLMYNTYMLQSSIQYISMLCLYKVHTYVVEFYTVHIHVVVIYSSYICCRVYTVLIHVGIYNAYTCCTVMHNTYML